MCSLYFDTFLNNNPLSLVQKLTQDPTTISPAAEIQPYFSENSPLTIPLQDHMSSRRLLEYTKGLLQQNPSQEIGAQVQTALRLHNEIERQHFLKEETCLFIVASRLLGTEEFEKIGSASHDLNKTSPYLEAQKTLNMLGIFL